MWIKDTSLGQRLKFVRKYRCMTQKELGILLGYPENQADIRIAQYENNSRNRNLSVQRFALIRRTIIMTHLCVSTNWKRR